MCNIGCYFAPRWLRFDWPKPTARAKGNMPCVKWVKLIRSSDNGGGFHTNAAVNKAATDIKPWVELKQTLVSGVEQSRCQKINWKLRAAGGFKANNGPAFAWLMHKWHYCWAFFIQQRRHWLALLRRLNGASAARLQTRLRWNWERQEWILLVSERSCHLFSYKIDWRKSWCEQVSRAYTDVNVRPIHAYPRPNLETQAWQPRNARAHKTMNRR